VQTKEWWNVELKGIFPYSLGEAVWPISKQMKLAVGSSEAFLLQMQPHFVAHLEVVWHPMLIMSLLVLSIGSVQDVMNLLADVFNVLNEFVCLIYLTLDMR
jgi:hypothetical protein